MGDVDNQQGSNGTPEDPDRPGYMKGGVTGKGFMPGKSGNPLGRPKRKTLSEMVAEILDTHLETITLTDGKKRTTITVTKGEALALKIANKAVRKLDIKLIKYLGERLDPKVKAGDGGGDDTPKVMMLPAGGPWGGVTKVRTPELADKEAPIRIPGVLEPPITPPPQEGG